MKLISKEICPFVQRVRIVLEEKEKLPDMQIVHIDTKHKPDWFLALSPLGKVPTLQIDDQSVLFESLVIMNYLEEVYPPTLLPLNVVKRAMLQSWMAYCDTLMGKFANIRKSQNVEEFNTHLNGFRAAFYNPILQNLAKEGGYFDGHNFTLLDATYAPLFVWCRKFRAYFDVEVLPTQSRLATWVEALLARESVKNTLVKDYDRLLKAYLIETNPKIEEITQAVIKKVV